MNDRNKLFVPGLCKRTSFIHTLKRTLLLLFVLAWIAGRIGITSDATAYMLDLTTAGAEGFINGALFWEGSVHPAGSGVILPFVRIGTNKEIEQGYNTDARPVQFDEKTDPNFTRSLLLSDVPIITIDGIDYREFFLDINEPASYNKSKISLDELEIYLGERGDLNDYPNLGELKYDLDAGETDNWIMLDYNLNSGGSGWSDMFTYIPDSLFTGQNEYVYLYSIFGEKEPNNNNYEEWGADPDVPAAVPEPATMLLGSGLIGLAGFRKKFRKR